MKEDDSNVKPFEDLKYKVRSTLINQKATRDVYKAARYDARRFLAYSSSHGPFRDRQNLAAKITEKYHALEKGLSLRHPRPGFGAAKIEALLRLTDRYVSDYGSDAVSEAAYGALAGYLAFNQEAGLSDEDIPYFSEMKEAFGGIATRTGGTIDMTRQSVAEAVNGVGLKFFKTRHSTRQFTKAPVSGDDLEFAAIAAASAPAVCNREFAQVHVWRNPSTIARLLEIQGGAQGFANDIPCLAMITASVRNYWGAGERNQAWIDGGLFAMSFILGLHARALGSVSLNWSKRPEKDREMLRAAELDDSSAIIFLIGIGNLRDHYRVAASPRVQSSLVLRD